MFNVVSELAHLTLQFLIVCFSLQVSAAAEYLWTSGKKHPLVDKMEFCSVLNTVIRDDYWSELEVYVEHATLLYSMI